MGEYTPKYPLGTRVVVHIEHLDHAGGHLGTVVAPPPGAARSTSCTYVSLDHPVSGYPNPFGWFHHKIDLPLTVKTLDVGEFVTVLSGGHRGDTGVVKTVGSDPDTPGPTEWARVEIDDGVKIRTITYDLTDLRKVPIPDCRPFRRLVLSIDFTDEQLEHFGPEPAHDPTVLIDVIAELHDQIEARWEL